MKWGMNRREKLAVILHSIHMLGFWMTLRYVLIDFLTYKPVCDGAYDRQFKTDTAGFVATSEMGIDDKTLQAQAVYYLPSPPRLSRYLINNLKINHADYTFVDFGSGKGRVVMIAAEYSFVKVVGVELSDKLHHIARHNLSLRNSHFPALRCEDIKLECCDARDFNLPEGNLVLHFYHPFSHEILRSVLQNVQRSLKDNPRQVLIVYLRPAENVKEVFQEIPILVQQGEIECVNRQYSWLLFASVPNP